MLALTCKKLNLIFFLVFYACKKLHPCFLSIFKFAKNAFWNLYSVESWPSTEKSLKWNPDWNIISSLWISTVSNQCFPPIFLPASYYGNFSRLKITKINCKNSLQQGIFQDVSRGGITDKKSEILLQMIIEVVICPVRNNTNGDKGILVQIW